MDRDEKLLILESRIRTALDLRFDDISMKEMNNSYAFELKSNQGSKVLTITKYLLDDNDFGDVRCYVVNVLSQLDSTERLVLTTQSFDDFYKCERN